MRHLRLAYRWHEGETSTVSSYMSLSPFAWHWLSPYGDKVETRSLYIADLNGIRKYPCDMTEWISKTPASWAMILRGYKDEFVVKDDVPAIAAGAEIERLVRAKDEYIEYIYETFVHEKVAPTRCDFDQDYFDFFQREKRRMEKLWEHRVLRLCKRKWLNHLWRKKE